MSTTKLFFAIISLILISITSSKAQCIPASCGNIREVKSPFRLKSDPQQCGELGYELDCQNNETIFNYKSRKFYVQEINYEKFSIRLLDPGLKNQRENCTALPEHRASWNAMTSSIFQWVRADNDINYVSCDSSINLPQYVPATFCNGRGSNFSYLVIGEILTDSDLAKGCRVDTVAWSAAPGILSSEPNLLGTRRSLAYGFELSWQRNWLCRVCDANGDNACIVEENSNEVTCKNYCKEDTPVSERSFRCKVEYYTVFVLAYGGIGLGVKYLIGIPLLIAVVIWQCKKRNENISNDGLVEKAREPSSNEQNC